MDSHAIIPPLIVAFESRYQQWEGSVPVWNLDGVTWSAAEPPRMRHRHWAQTVGNPGAMRETWRCPCGAFGGPLDPWVRIDKRRSRRRWRARRAASP